MTFVDTVLRIEHIPENSKTGIALEIRINKYVWRVAEEIDIPIDMGKNIYILIYNLL